MNIKKTLAMLLAVALVAGIYSPIGANAATYYSFNEKDIKLTTVLDVDNSMYPETDKYYVPTNSHQSTKFTITEPSVMKAYYTWDTGLINSVTGNIWISRDYQGIDVVGTKATVANKAPTSAVFFLDPGTYYLNHNLKIKVDKYETGEYIGLALLQQPVRTDEQSYVTSFESPNSLSKGKDLTGFLSDNSPYDYYCLSINEYSRVDFDFNFRKEGGTNVSKGVCALYDSNHRLIVKKTFNESNYTANTFSQYLEKGTYFVEMSGAAGPTYLRADVVSYDIRCTKSDAATKEDVKVKVVYDFDAAEVLIVPGTIVEAKKADSSTWNVRNGAVDVTATNTFMASENGNYTARIKDTAGKFYLSYFEVSSIDRDAPVVTVEETKKTNTVKVVITDKNMKSIKLDSKKVKIATAEKTNGKKTIELSGVGTHKVVVKDAAGNSTTLKFKIGK